MLTGLRRSGLCGGWVLKASVKRARIKRGEKTVVVPQHKPIKPGTLRGMLDQAGISLEEFTLSH